MSWEVIKNCFTTTTNMVQSRNNRKRKKKSYQRKSQIPLSVKTTKLNHSFQAKNLDSDLSVSSEKLYKSDCENDEEIKDILADICTNANYNITFVGLTCSSSSDNKPKHEHSFMKLDEVDLSLSNPENSPMKILQKNKSFNLNDSCMLKNTALKNDVKLLKATTNNHENTSKIENVCNENFHDALFSMYQIKPLKLKRLCLKKNSLIQSSRITELEKNTTNEKLEKENGIDKTKKKSPIKSVLNNENKNCTSIVENNTNKKQWLQPTQFSLCTKLSKNLKDESIKTIIEHNILKENKNARHQTFNILNTNLIKRKKEIKSGSYNKKKNMIFNTKKEIIDKNNSIQEKSNDWLKPNELIFTSSNSIESYRQELNESIIEDNFSDDNTVEDNCKNDLSKEIVFENSQSSPQKSTDNPNNNLGIVQSSQKSDLFPKNNETTIEYLSSVEYTITPNYNTKIMTQTSTEDDEKKSLEGEKELNLLIRDLQYFSKKSQRIKMKKGGFVEKTRNILKSNRSNYFFWKNEFENECIEYGNYGEIIDLYEFFTQTILKISMKSFNISIAVDLYNKIYKGQHFYKGAKVFFEIESFDPLVLDNGEKIYLGVNKILKLK